MITSLSFKFEKKSVMFEGVKNPPDTLLEFRRTWRFLTGAGILDHILDVFIFDNKLKFQI